MDKEIIKAESFSVVQGQLVFTDIRYDLFGWTNLCSEENEVIDYVSLGLGVKNRLFGDVMNIGNDYYLIPFSADQLIHVDIESKSIDKIRFDFASDVKLRSYCNSKFFSGHIVDESIYLVPATYPAIVEYNIATKKVRQYSDCIKEIIHVNGRDGEDSLFRKTLLCNNKIYAPLCKSDYVMVFDIDSKKWCIKRVDEYTNGYADICFDGESFWLASRKGNYLTKWNENEELPSRIKGRWDDNTAFSHVVFFDGVIWLFPMNGGKIGYFENEEFYWFDFYDKDGVFSVKIIDNVLYILSVMSGEVIKVYSRHNCEIQKVFFNTEISNRYHVYSSEIYNSISNNNACILQNERDENSLKDLVNTLVICD